MKLPQITFNSFGIALVICSIFGLISPIHSQISTYPYIQTFGSGTCSQPSGYSNSGSDPWDFQNVSEQYMEGLDHTSNGGCFASMDDSGTSADDSCLLTTPSFNLSSIPAAKLRFWWQNSNATTSVADTVGPRPWSNLYLDVSTDSGSTWTRNVWFVEDSQQIGWTEAFVPLDSFISGNTVLRFRGLETQTFRSDMSLDDILVYEPQTWDASLSEIVSPGAKSCQDSFAIVKVEVINNGLDTITSLPVYYSLDSGTAVSETLSVTILPQAAYVYSFVQKANIHSIGVHTIKAWVDLPLDSSYTNDTMFENFGTVITVSNFPYFEDYESGQQGWEMSGTNSSWAYGTPGKTIISGAASGTKAFVNGGLTGDYNISEVSEVTSPCFDFTALSGQLNIGADVWWETEESWDGVVLQYSTNGGSSWNNVGAYLDPNNWYTDNTIDANPGGQTEGWSGTGSTGSGSWVYAKNTLPLSLSGTPNVIFRVAFASDGSVQEEGFAFDNFSIFEPAAWDARVNALNTPDNKICGDSSVSIEIQVFNAGSNAISTLPVSYQVNNGVISTDTISATILPGNTYTYTFSQNANLLAVGNTLIKAWTTLALDSVYNNDTVTKPVNVLPTISTFPYLEDFENGQQSWEASGTNSSWAFGTPNKGTISGAASGVNAFVNGGLSATYNPLEISQVSSPCFDFSGVSAQSYIEADIWYETVTISDGAVVQYTTNNGASWTTIGVTNDPVNWYNYNFITANPGGQAEGWTGSGTFGSGNWINARHILPTNLIGAVKVQFRVAFASINTTTTDGFAFDNFKVYIPNPWDASVVNLNSPSLVGCGDSSAVVEIEVYNAGSDTIKTLPVSFQLDGGAIITDTIIAVIDPAATFTHAFIQTVNLSTVGAHDLKTWTGLALDTLKDNDTLISNLNTSATINTYPYYEDFENGQQGWEMTGVNSTWAFGTPAKATIQGASSGVNAFVNGGLAGNYNDYEVSEVSSPCFDIPATTNDVWVALDVWWEIENTWDGAVLQYKTDSVATWTNIGSFNDPYNWFNHDSIFSNPGGQGEGWTGNDGINASGAWVAAKHRLPVSILGETGVVFRVAFASDNIINDDGMAFDNFAIVEFSKVNIDSHQVATCDTIPIELNTSQESWGRYKWNDNSNGDSLMVNTTGRYWVQFTDTILNLKSYDTTYVYFYTPPVTQFASKLDSIYLSDSIVLDPGLSKNFNYLWTPGNDTTPTLKVRGVDYGLGSFVFNVSIEDTNSCSVIDSVEVVVMEDTATGVFELTSQQIEFYPNPVSDVLNIESSVISYEVSIYNNQGQLMLHDSMNGRKGSIDLSFLDNGMYVLIIKAGDSVLKIEKLIKD